jgi:hypothetical protein
MRTLSAVTLLLCAIHIVVVHATNDQGSGDGSSGSADDDHSEEGHGAHDPTFIGIFCIVALFMGIFTELFMQWTQLPYTVLLLIEGMLIGWLDYHLDLGGYTYSLNVWVDLDAHTISTCILLNFERVWLIPQNAVQILFALARGAHHDTPPSHISHYC